MVGDVMIGSSSDHAAHVVNTDRLLSENDSVRRHDEGTDRRVRRATDRRARTPKVSATSRSRRRSSPDGTKEFTLTASVVDWQVDPDTTVKAWTYNGRCPGRGSRSIPATRCGSSCKNELPQSTVDPLPRHRGAERDGRRSRRHAAAGQARRIVHLRVRRQGPGARHVPLAPPRGAPGPRRALRCVPGRRRAAPGRHRRRSRRRCRWC